MVAASRSPPRIACSTESRYSAILGEMGRSTRKVVGSVIDSVVGSGAQIGERWLYRSRSHLEASPSLDP